ncbi:GNAT family N-acetyltransferase [bacterium]|nr:MAG: GNAT family N-acetyltransferase [bacterium]
MAQSGTTPTNPIRVTLSDGTLAVVRPIRPDGAPQLIEALNNLSPQARYQRFLYGKHSLSPDELRYLTDCDGINHIALVLLLTDTDGNELYPVAEARCIRDQYDTSMAEVAITVADQWQNKGVGKHLLKALANAAVAVGIERWQAFLLHSNTAAFKLMETVGTKQSELPEYTAVLKVTYKLHPNLFTH